MERIRIFMVPNNKKQSVEENFLDKRNIKKCQYRSAAQKYVFWVKKIQRNWTRSHLLLILAQSLGLMFLTN